MPYRKYARSNRKRNYRRRQAAPSKAIRSMVRREIRRDNMKDHPLQWVDISLTGEYVKTTPLVHDFTTFIHDYIVDNELYNDWPSRLGEPGGSPYRHANVYFTGYQYQFRYQQNAEYTGDVLTDSVRMLAYSLKEYQPPAFAGILDGGDIDQPPNTEDVLSMYKDQIITLRASYTEGEADDTQFVPGQRWIKGFKKLYLKQQIIYQADNIRTLEGPSIYIEHQSDDASATVGKVQVYGFVRIYFRIVE